ncbi:MAG: TlpA family protein disulfide reductase [Janthinobacterium lividum]
MQTVLGLLAVAVVFGAAGIYAGIARHGAVTAPVDGQAVPAAVRAAAPAAAATSATGATAVAQLFAQSMPDIAGKPQPLAAWKGKTLVVNFWATWCAPCVEEMPELSALQTALAGSNVQIIGLGVDTAASIGAFAERYRIAYPLYVAGLGGAELSRRFGNQTGGLPFTVIIGADGNIKKTYLGRLTMENLRRDLATL